MNRIEVQNSRAPFVAAGLLGLFFLLFAAATLHSAFARGFKIGPLLVFLLIVTSYGAVIWLFRRGYARSVKYFTDEGLTRNDGRQFAWTDLSRVVDQIHRRRTDDFIWRTEIQFQDGETAWLIPSKVRNHRVIRELVANLPCEHTEVRV